MMPDTEPTAAELREAATQLCDALRTVNELNAVSGTLMDRLRRLASGPCKEEDRCDELEEKMHQIDSWCRAYPLDVFPEPDWKKAREGLESVGVNMGAVSAANMRHVVEGIRRIINARSLKAAQGKEETDAE